MFLTAPRAASANTCTPFQCFSTSIEFEGRFFPSFLNYPWEKYWTGLYSRKTGLGTQLRFSSWITEPQDGLGWKDHLTFSPTQTLNQAEMWISGKVMKRTQLYLQVLQADLAGVWYHPSKVLSQIWPAIIVLILKQRGKLGRADLGHWKGLTHLGFPKQSQCKHSLGWIIWPRLEQCLDLGK